MTLRADHIAGFCFIVVGGLIIALSGDLPFGTLASPGAGFMPVCIAVLTMIFGAVLALGAAHGPALASIDWSDIGHAAVVIAVIAATAALFLWLGFIITTLLMMLTLLIALERRPVVTSVIYAAGAVLLTYATFQYVLNTPLVYGPFGF